MSSKKRKQRADEGQGQAEVPDVPPPPVLDFPAAGSRESLGGQSQTRVRRSSRSGGSSTRSPGKSSQRAVDYARRPQQEQLTSPLRTPPRKFKNAGQSSGPSTPRAVELAQQQQQGASRESSPTSSSAGPISGQSTPRGVQLVRDGSPGDGSQPPPKKKLNSGQSSGQVTPRAASPVQHGAQQAQRSGSNQHSQPQMSAGGGSNQNPDPGLIPVLQTTSLNPGSDPQAFQSFLLSEQDVLRAIECATVQNLTTGVPGMVPKIPGVPEEANWLEEILIEDYNLSDEDENDQPAPLQLEGLPILPPPGQETEEDLVRINNALDGMTDLENPGPATIRFLDANLFPRPGDPGWEEFLASRRPAAAREPDRFNVNELQGGAARQLTVDEALSVRTPLHATGIAQPAEVIHPTDTHLLQLLDWMRYLVAAQRRPRYLDRPEQGERLRSVLEEFKKSFQDASQELNLAPTDEHHERANYIRSNIWKEQRAHVPLPKVPLSLRHYEGQISGWASYLQAMRNTPLRFSSEDSKHSFMSVLRGLKMELGYTIRDVFGEYLRQAGNVAPIPAPPRPPSPPREPSPPPPPSPGCPGLYPEDPEGSPGPAEDAAELAVLIQGSEFRSKLVDWTLYLCAMRRTWQRLSGRIAAADAQTYFTVLTALHRQLRVLMSRTFNDYESTTTPEAMGLQAARKDHRLRLQSASNMIFRVHEKHSLKVLQRADLQSFDDWVHYIRSMDGDQPAVLPESRNMFVVTYHAFYDELYDTANAVLGRALGDLLNVEPIRHGLNWIGEPRNPAPALPPNLALPNAALDLFEDLEPAPMNVDDPGAQPEAQAGQGIPDMPMAEEQGGPQPEAPQPPRGRGRIMQVTSGKIRLPSARRREMARQAARDALEDPRAWVHPAAEDRVPPMYRDATVVRLFETPEQRHINFKAFGDARGPDSGQREVGVPRTLTAEEMADQQEYHTLFLKELKRLEIDLCLAIMGVAKYQYMPRPVQNDIRFYIIAYHKFIRGQVDHCDHKCAQTQAPQNCCYSTKFAPLNAILDREVLNKKLLEMYIYDVSKLLFDWACQTRARALRYPQFVKELIRQWIDTHPDHTDSSLQEWEDLSMKTGIPFKLIKCALRCFKRSIAGGRRISHQALPDPQPTAQPGQISVANQVQNFLISWMEEHRQYSFPIEIEMRRLIEITRLSRERIKSWMVEYRNSHDFPRHFIAAIHTKLNRQRNGLNMDEKYAKVGDPIIDPQIRWNQNIEIVNENIQNPNLNNEIEGNEILNENVVMDHPNNQIDGQFENLPNLAANVNNLTMISNEVISDPNPYDLDMIQNQANHVPNQADLIMVQNQTQQDILQGEDIFFSYTHAMRESFLEGEEKEGEERFLNDAMYFDQQEIPPRNFVIEDGTIVPISRNIAEQIQPFVEEWIEPGQELMVDQAMQDIAQNQPRSPVLAGAVDPILPDIQPHLPVQGGGPADAVDPIPPDIQQQAAAVGQRIAELEQHPLEEARNEIQVMNQEGQLPAAVANEALANIENQEDEGLFLEELEAELSEAEEEPEAPNVNHGAREALVTNRWEPDPEHATDLKARVTSMTAWCIFKRHGAIFVAEREAAVDRLISSHVAFSRRTPAHTWLDCVNENLVLACCYNNRYGDIDNIQGEQARLDASLPRFDAKIFQWMSQVANVRDPKSRVSPPGFVCRYLDNWCANNVRTTSRVAPEDYVRFENDVGVQVKQAFTFLKKWRDHCVTNKAKKAALPREVTPVQLRFMKQWFEENLDDPYLSDYNRASLIADTGMSESKDDGFDI